jgi:hypothetical protein
MNAALAAFELGEALGLGNDEEEMRRAEQFFMEMFLEKQRRTELLQGKAAAPKREQQMAELLQRRQYEVQLPQEEQPMAEWTQGEQPVMELPQKEQPVARLHQEEQPVPRKRILNLPRWAFH